jgi:hypothetical protein
MFDRFELEGTTYYQQGRKCGKAGCHCQNGGELHGPYWWARNDHGQRSYVGRDLPEAIARAREVHDRRLPELLAERRRLVAELDAMTRLLCNKALHAEDLPIIERLGFGDCLVSAGELQAAQGG